MKHKLNILKTDWLSQLSEERWLKIVFVLFIFSLLTASCEEPRITPEDGYLNNLSVQGDYAKELKEDNCLTVTLGDKDGFGLGLVEGDFYWPSGIFPFDFSSESDPDFTDIYPADHNYATGGSDRQIIFNMEFKPRGKSIGSAELKFFTLGVADGDEYYLNYVNPPTDFDIKLFVDDIEIPNAFDTIDQFQYVPSFREIAGLVSFKIPDNQLSILEDGKITVRLEILTLTPDQSPFDAIGIDYCELKMCPGRKH